MSESYTLTSVMAIVFVPAHEVDCSNEFERWTKTKSATAGTQCVGPTPDGLLARVELLTDNILGERVVYALHAYEHSLLPFRYAPGFELSQLGVRLGEVARGARESQLFQHARRLALTVAVRQPQPSSEAAARAIQSSLSDVLIPTTTDYVDLTLTYNARTEHEGTRINRLVQAETLQNVDFLPGQPARPKAFAASWTFDFSTVHGQDPLGTKAEPLLDVLVDQLTARVKAVLR